MKPKNKAAATLGRKGGKATSQAKTEACRENGKKGARVRWQDQRNKIVLCNLPEPYECPSCGEQMLSTQAGAGDCLGFGHANLSLE